MVAKQNCIKYFCWHSLCCVLLVLFSLRIVVKTTFLEPSFMPKCNIIKLELIQPSYFIDRTRIWTISILLILMEVMVYQKILIFLTSCLEKCNTKQIFQLENAQFHKCPQVSDMVDIKWEFTQKWNWKKVDGSHWLP